jgi:methylated-DNA-[protein]-cysteine S-methyltransferase
MANVRPIPFPPTGEKISPWNYVIENMTSFFMDKVLQLLLDQIETPLGELLIAADQDGNLRATSWSDYQIYLRPSLELHYGRNGFTIKPGSNPDGLTDAIARYFAGDLSAIDTLPVQTGGTPFQRDVWRALREIPCGTTISYAALAARIDRPNAVRAVGLANGSNPVGVVVPCHRVIGSDGSLTGYGGGIERKRWLLRHERALANDLGF